ncbi:MAG: hypothetical protein HUJ56_00940, partial [Erysipelotrichaceae bacterium]|nr:hypothetical protein [Erysipelotrichaceae bacterium]
MSKVDQVKDKVTKVLDENGDGKLTIEDGIRKAFLLPGMKIDRTRFLTKELSKYYPEDIVQQAIATNPMKAGIDSATINQLADKAIKTERNHVAGTTALLATPGGFAMLVTAPADVIQFYGYLLRCIQKLLYLYGFPELKHNEQKILDESTVNIIVACFGVMSGVAKAKSALVGIAKVLSTDIERTILEFTFAQAA